MSKQIPYCHASVHEEDETCGRCGAEFEFLCPTCDKPMKASASQCNKCGTKVEK